MPDYTLFPNLAGLLETLPAESIVSRTIYKDAQLNVILFGFDLGQELSEHTSSKRAIIQIMQGEASVTLGGDTHELGVGAWLHMPPRMPHSVLAKTPLVMLLLMFDTD